MAKEKKAEAPVANQECTVDNVMDTIRKGNLMDKALTTQVLDEIQKEKDERKAKDLKERILKANYRRLRALLQLRARRRESNITKEKLERSELLQDMLSGFELTPAKIQKHGGKDNKITVDEKEYAYKEGETTWVPGTITIQEYDDKSRDISNDIRKKMCECDEVLSKELNELRAQYPGWWRYDWDD